MSTQPMNAHFGCDPANFYVWRVSDAFAIHLSLKVVTQLAAQISRAGQIRGILLGRAVETPIRATLIEDFKLLPPSEDGGAHPDSEDALFEIACRMVEPGSPQRAIGFFRSGRDGNLNLGPRDIEIFSGLFCETGNLALVIQTPPRGESEAALFYWQHGMAQPHDFGFGFPLDANQLANGHPGWRYPNPLQNTQPEAAPVSPKPPSPKWPPASGPAQGSASGERIRWARLVPTAALVIVAIGALQMFGTSNQSVSAAPELSSVEQGALTPSEAASAAAVAGSEKYLGLTVTSRQHQLEIRWNRESAAILASKSGEMKITEDGITEAVPFDQAQLRDGYVAYTPKTNDVSIRLQVTAKDGGTTSESIRSVAIP